MRVVLGNAEPRRVWIDSVVPSDSLTELLRPHLDDKMHAHVVSRHVNNPRNEGPNCIRPGSPSCRFPGPGGVVVEERPSSSSWAYCGGAPGMARPGASREQP